MWEHSHSVVVAGRALRVAPLEEPACRAMVLGDWAGVAKVAGQAARATGGVRLDAAYVAARLSSATASATVLGTLAAMGLSRPSFPLRSLIMPFLVSPMIIPIVVVAVSLSLVFSPLGLVNSYAGLILAPAALGPPFVVITVTATLMSFDRNLTKAAANLGASPWTAFRRVMLPLIMPGVATGAIFAFATSFDEVIVALFINSPTLKTLPVQIYNSIRSIITPCLAAISVVFVVVAALAIAALDRLVGLDIFLKSK